MTPFNRAFTSGAPARFWHLGSAQGAALLNMEVTRQARIIAYVDNFKLMLVLAIAALPLLLLTRPPAAKPPAVRSASDKEGSRPATV